MKPCCSERHDVSSDLSKKIKVQLSMECMKSLEQSCGVTAACDWSVLNEDYFSVLTRKEKVEDLVSTSPGEFQITQVDPQSCFGRGNEVLRSWRKIF